MRPGLKQQQQQQLYLMDLNPGLIALLSQKKTSVYFFKDKIRSTEEMFFTASFGCIPSLVLKMVVSRPFFILF